MDVRAGVAGREERGELRQPGGAVRGGARQRAQHAQAAAQAPRGRRGRGILRPVPQHISTKVAGPKGHHYAPLEEHAYETMAVLP